MQTRAFAAVSTNVLTLQMSYVKSLPVFFKKPMPPPSLTYSTTMMMMPSMRTSKRTWHCPPPFFKNGMPFTMNFQTQPPKPSHTPVPLVSCPLPLLTTTTTINWKTTTNHQSLTALMTPSASCAMQSKSWKQSTTNSHNYLTVLRPKPLASRLSNTRPTICSHHNHAQNCTLQHALMRVLPPAPNPPASPIQNPAQPASQIECSLHTVPGTMPIVHHPAPTIIPCKFPRPPTTKTTIPNWAKPAIPPPASNLMAGTFCMGEPTGPCHNWTWRQSHSRKNHQPNPLLQPARTPSTRPN